MSCFVVVFPTEPVTPITVYFDPAIPAPVRHAMKQGLLWWNKAYEAAGFRNALVAKDAPADKLTLERSKQVTLDSWKRPVKQPKT